ncbi:MAG TPA: EthD domain-containing protein [Candidatus Binataceae bacterium]|nr:EthD domain-containing protein [Candidatus Binataceae bacterium]
MVKFLTLVTAAADQDSAGFRRWFLHEHAPAVLRHCPRLRRCVVNLREPAPAIENMPHFEQGAGPRRRYQAAAEMCFDSAEDFTDRARLYDSPEAGRRIEDALAGKAGEAFTYRVTEVIEKAAHPTRIGERSAGIKMIPLAGWKQGLTDEEGRLAWEVHGPLALRIHTGFSKYVRNVVEQSLTPGAPNYRGIGELQFLTIDDAVHRFFPSPAAARIIEFDTARWMVAYDGAFFSEYVLK